MVRMISYSQNGEDVILKRVFENQEVGFYIDIGASHPEHLSVTKFFYEQGWSGINVDPLRSAYELFSADRTRDTNLHFAIGENKGFYDFYEVSDYLELSTFSSEAAAELSKQGYQVISYPVEVITGNELFTSHAPASVDFLKIDVEGSELSVLKSIDFLQHRPKVLLIEATIPNAKFPGWEHFKSIFNFSSWEPIILSNGYVFAYFDGLNRYYVRAENKDLLSYFQVGLCLYDSFMPYPQFKYISELEWNCSERLKQIDALNEVMVTREADRAARGTQIDTLTAMLKSSESRLTAQEQELTAQTKEIEILNAACCTLSENINALFTRKTFKILSKVLGWTETSKIITYLATFRRSTNSVLYDSAK